MQIHPYNNEIYIIYFGIAAYALSAVLVWYNAWYRHARWQGALRLMLAGAALLGVAIALRWWRAGYGPFLTLFEVLLSNLFSLGLLYALVYRFVPAARAGAPVVLAVLLLLGIWLLNVPSQPGNLPATYQSPWLWIHVGVGKVFLGACLVAAGLAGTLLLGRLSRVRSRMDTLAHEAVLDAVLWRFLAVAFVFHSLMLIAGAVWAQDAWGRYWAWDSLETWAFLTWLALGASLHAKATLHMPLCSGWASTLLVFVLAFITFFGVPFSSIGPHKGVI